MNTDKHLEEAVLLRDFRYAKHTVECCQKKIGGKDCDCDDDFVLNVHQNDKVYSQYCVQYVKTWESPATYKIQQQ
jgi:hypothetical protein